MSKVDASILNEACVEASITGAAGARPLGELLDKGVGRMRRTCRTREDTWAGAELCGGVLCDEPATSMEDECRERGGDGGSY